MEFEFESSRESYLLASSLRKGIALARILTRCGLIQTIMVSSIIINSNFFLVFVLLFVFWLVALSVVSQFKYTSVTILTKKQGISSFLSIRFRRLRLTRLPCRSFRSLVCRYLLLRPSSDRHLGPQW